MKPTVLLINPYQAYPWANIWGFISKPGIPLGLAQIAACLKKAGVSVEALDANQKQLQAHKLEVRLPVRPPDWIGITAYTPGAYEAYRIAKLCRQKYPGVLIVMGGPHAMGVLDEPLRIGGVDFVVLGDGETPLVELVLGKPPAEISGVLSSNNLRSLNAPSYALEPDLDRLPIPAYDLFDPRLYGVTRGRARKHPAMSLVVSRGCNHGCAFCFSGTKGTPLRTRSVDLVCEEIEQLHRDYGIMEFAFQDDVFTANREWVSRFCLRLQALDLGISWSCLSRVDTVDTELLKLIKSAGCHQVGFGVESGSQSILRQMGKNINPQQAEQAVGLARKVGLEVVTYYVLGFLGESEKTLQQTLELSVRLKPDYCVYNIAIPFPGTRMYQEAQASKRLASQDWTKYNGSEVTLKYERLTQARLQKAYKSAYRNFYFSPRFFFGTLLQRFLNQEVQSL